MPVIFQKSISDTDISSNPEIFYALSGGERHNTSTEQILHIHNMKNIKSHKKTNLVKNLKNLMKRNDRKGL